MTRWRYEYGLHGRSSVNCGFETSGRIGTRGRPPAWRGAGDKCHVLKFPSQSFCRSLILLFDLAKLWSSTPAASRPPIKGVSRTKAEHCWSIRLDSRPTDLDAFQRSSTPSSLLPISLRPSTMSIFASNSTSAPALIQIPTFSSPERTQTQAEDGPSTNEQSKPAQALTRAEERQMRFKNANT